MPAVLRAKKLLLTALPVVLAACLAPEPNSEKSGLVNTGTNSAAQPQSQRRLLRAAIVPEPGVFRHTGDTVGGFELSLLNKLAEQLGLRLEITEVSNRATALHALQGGGVDIAAAHFGTNQYPPKWQRWSLPLISSPVAIAFNPAETVRPASMLDLLTTQSELVIANDGRYSELARQQQHLFPELSWLEPAGLSRAAALQRLAASQSLFSFTDKHDMRLYQLRFPMLSAAFTLRSKGQVKQRKIAWALQQKNAVLNQAINRFIAQQHISGALQQHYSAHFNHLNKLDSGTVITFRRLASQRLGNYQAWLQQASDEYGYDWRLIAAMAFQESRWNPLAKSPTGVRGFMMLTRQTARELGVQNRRDARQSIFGGVKFLHSLSSRFGTTVREPDRTWLALAAYNIGMGHLRDARQLTFEAGENSSQWMSIKRQLPKLAEKPGCQTLRFGCARGQEAVDYVTNIRAFYDLLSWHRPSIRRRSAAPTASVSAGVVETDKAGEPIRVSAGVRQ